MRPVMAKAIGYMKPDIDPNVRLYVPFNEGVGDLAKDYSQYCNHVQLTDVEWSPDGFNGAGVFNGVSSFGECGGGADPCWDITDAISVDVFVNRKTTAEAWPIILGRGVTVPSFWLQLKNIDEVSFWINNGAHQALTTDANLAVGARYRLIGTYDKDIGGVDEIKLYVNGILKATADYSTAIATSNENFLIGKHLTYFFKGTIYEVLLRAITRSAAQIAADCYEVCS